MAVLQIGDNLTQGIDNGNYIVGFILDLTKVFNIVDHNTILSKLSHYGVRGIALY